MLNLVIRFGACDTAISCTGTIHIKHARRGGLAGAIRNDRAMFWRETIDLDLFKVVTDAPVTALCD